MPGQDLEGLIEVQPSVGLCTSGDRTTRPDSTTVILVDEDRFLCYLFKGLIRPIPDGHSLRARSQLPLMAVEQRLLEATLGQHPQLGMQGSLGHVRISVLCRFRFSRGSLEVTARWLIDLKGMRRTRLLTVVNLILLVRGMLGDGPDAFP